MIIQMIARNIGEGGRRETDAVKAALLEPMARGFEREMRDAILSKPGENGVQLVVFGLTTPMVPRLAEGMPCPSQSWRTKEATDVLPLVPVTATTVSG